ncbi:RNA polymerase sigma factor [Micromonospora halophytica]|uniref:RNA polymerase sigma factor, sigma-70 family n=1 Tax=Micromonospora halophytica TaxID=47864 RepID=A0A1C5GZG8_9ACTN|nr:sigma-70 family RNA polymerase sigma factor [Micromonospora halophytica]SCG39176.1 RNA polymerase sigma factor, sigma-70 family [Micromonospora halophytica]
MDTAAQDDIALVEAVRRGERAGLEGMYRRYADRLYTYARTVLREPEAAADAVHDAFLTAGQRIGQLREPARLRPWLYAIVRNECLRQLRDRSRSLPLEEAGEPVADIADPATGVNAAQVRHLVHAAADALNPGDREVVHLAIRHDLSSADIGAALGVPANHAHARLSRARSQLERALGALLVARTGARDCPALAGLIDGWQGRLTPILRKRVSRHIESCVVCGSLRQEQLSPAVLLSAYTAPAFLVVAESVWPRLIEAIDVPADAIDVAEPAVEAGAVRFEPATDLTPAADEPAGPVDGPVDAPPPATAEAASSDRAAVHPDGAAAPDRVAVSPGDAAVAPEHLAEPAQQAAMPAVPADGGAVLPDRAAGSADPTAVPRDTPHPVRTTSPERRRRRRRVAATAAPLILLAVLGAWALAPGRPTAQDGSGRPVAGTIGSRAGEPVAPAAAPLPSGAATAAGNQAPGTTASADPAGATPGTGTGPADAAGAARPGTPAAPTAPEVVPDGTPPTPTPVPTAPRPTGPPRVTAPFTVSATGAVRCGAQTYSLAVRATGSATLRNAEVRWTPSGGRTSARAATVDGSAAQATIGSLSASTLTWSVRATAADGRTAQSPTYTVTDPCVRPG